MIQQYASEHMAAACLWVFDVGALSAEVVSFNPSLQCVLRRAAAAAFEEVSNVRMQAAQVMTCGFRCYRQTHHVASYKSQ
jgi:hypothetical protein